MLLGTKLLYDKPLPRRLGWSQREDQISYVDVDVDVGVCGCEKGVYSSNGRIDRQQHEREEDVWPPNGINASLLPQAPLMLWAQVPAGRAIVVSIVKSSPHLNR